MNDTTTIPLSRKANRDAPHDDHAMTTDTPRGMGGGMNGSYTRFFAMIATSMLVMYALMYLNTYEFAHVAFSEMRLYMNLIMGAAMAVIMLAFMLSMYTDRRMNLLIVIGAAVMFAVALWAARAQTLVDDSAWMKAMIPHHSIAILTSSRADIDDVRVRALAEEIIKAQEREIAEMEWLLADIAANGKATDAADARARTIPEF